MRCGTWRGLTVPSTPNCRLFGRLTGDLIGKNTSTDVTMEGIDQVSRFDVDGSMGAGLSFDSPVASTFVMHVGSISSFGRIYLDTGSITRIQVATNITAGASTRSDATIATGAGNILLVNAVGSIRADITARGTPGSPTQGRIFDIIAGDHIGRAYSPGTNAYGDPDSATAFPYLNPGVLNGPVLCIEATNGVNLVEANTMTCLIESDRQLTSTDAIGKIESVVTRTGSFKGMLQVQGLQDNDSGTGGATVDIAADFRGRVRMDPTTSAAGAFIGLFKVRGSLLPLTLTDNMSNTEVQKAFVLRTGALQGQVIVNANDDSEAWSADVQVGSTTLTQTGGIYATPSAGLGGGAVGLAPFQFYDVDCFPPNNDLDHADSPLSSDFASSAIPVVMRWYGPVKLPTGVTDPMDLLIIEAQDPRPGNECEWIDLTSIFTATMHPGGDARAIGIGSITLPRETVYRVRYNDDAISESIFFECDEVDGNPPIDFSVDACDSFLKSYMFTIVPDCNNNGTSDVVEIAGNSSLDANMNGIIDCCEFIDPCSCDWDDNGVLGVPDIFDFLSDWFANDTTALNFGGTPGVPAIFAFLSCWFANACE